MDTVSLGGAIAVAIELYERGILTKEDTDGLDLTFGNPDALLDALRMIAFRKGLGDMLADGVRSAAESISNGAEEIAVHVKGLEVPMHDPRIKRGLGLGYAVCAIGADHITNMHDTSYASKIPRGDQGLGLIEPVATDDFGPKKVRLFKNAMTWKNLNNCLVMCLFPPWTVAEKTQIVESVTGWNTSAYELMKVSQRSLVLARLFNIREGLTSGDDVLPPRFYTPTTDGALSQTRLDPAELNAAKELYYEMEGWTPDGVPLKATLDDLDIGWAADFI
jgi:aldehyde:ferredoxin oxidoreductase